MSGEVRHRSGRAAESPWSALGVGNVFIYRSGREVFCGWPWSPSSNSSDQDVIFYVLKENKVSELKHAVICCISITLDLILIQKTPVSSF